MKIYSYVVMYKECKKKFKNQPSNNCFSISTISIFYSLEAQNNFLFCPFQIAKNLHEHGL